MADPNKKVYPSAVYEVEERGLTLKEYFAGQALMGLLTQTNSQYNTYDEYIVKRAITIAEDMCKNL